MDEIKLPHRLVFIYLRKKIEVVTNFLPENFVIDTFAISTKYQTKEKLLLKDLGTFVPR